MRVVHVFWSLTYGGIETMLVNIANAQAESGAEVHICIIKDVYKEELIRSFRGDVTLHFLHGQSKIKRIGSIFKLNRLLMQLQPDAIHLHSCRLYTYLWHNRLKRVTSATLHDLPNSKRGRDGFLSKLFPFLITSNTIYNMVPRVFSISCVVKKMLLEKYGVRSTVVCNGILTKNFLLRQERLSHNPLRIVMVSRLNHEHKGQDLLIKAAVGLNGLVHVDLIGDGSSKDYLQKLIYELHAEDLVSLLGTKPQPYIAEHLADYDLFVQPSRWEGFGLTVAEAMAAKVPVLVTAGQGPAEVTCGDKFGWTFENGNVDDLTTKIQYILEHYNEAMNKAESALCHVRNTYDVSVTARKYLDLYNSKPTRQG